MLCLLSRLLSLFSNLDRISRVTTDTCLVVQHKSRIQQLRENGKMREGRLGYNRNKQRKIRYLVIGLMD